MKNLDEVWTGLTSSEKIEIKRDPELWGNTTEDNADKKIRSARFYPGSLKLEQAIRLCALLEPHGYNINDMIEETTNSPSYIFEQS